MLNKSPLARIVAALRRRLGGGDGVVANILILASGSVMARVVALAAVPILTRIYRPEDYGVLALFAACVAAAVPLATLRYQVAIPLPRSDRVAAQVLVLALLLVVVVTIACVLLIWIGGDAVFKLLAIEALAPYRWLIAVAIAGTGTYEVFQYWSLRQKRMRAVARTLVVQSVVGSATKIGLGLASYLPVGLLVGQIMKQGGGVVSLARQFWLDMRGQCPRTSPRRLSFVARRYAGFPTMRLPSQLLLVAAAQLPVWLVARTFGVDTAGQFALAFTTLALPISLTVQSVGNAYYAEIARLGKHRRAEIRRLTHDIMKKLALVASLPVLFLVFFGPAAFAIVFGDAWRSAGGFAQAMVLYLFMQIVTAPVLHVLTVFERNRQFLVINLVRVVLVLSAFLLADTVGFDSMETVIAYSVVLAGHYAFVAIGVLRLLSRPVVV